MGRNLVDVPHLETVVVAGGLIAAAGGGAHDDLLTAIAAGDAVVVPALFERNGGMHAGDVELATDTASGRLSGSMMYRSEEHTSELQSLMRISYAVFCLK